MVAPQSPGAEEREKNEKRKEAINIFSISIAPNWLFLMPYAIGFSYLVLLLISQMQILLFFTPISILLRWLSACSITATISGVTRSTGFVFTSIGVHLRSLLLLLLHIVLAHPISKLRV